MELSLKTIQTWAVQKGLDPKNLSDSQVSEALVATHTAVPTQDVVKAYSAALHQTAYEDPSGKNFGAVTPHPGSAAGLPSIALGEPPALTEADFVKTLPPLSQAGIEKYLQQAGFEKITLDEGGISGSRWLPNSSGDLDLKKSHWDSPEAFAKDADGFGAQVPNELKPRYELANRFAKANGYNVLRFMPHRDAIALEDVAGLHTSDQPIEVRRQLYLPV